MPDTTWRPPDDKPESLYDHTRWSEIADWCDRRDRAWNEWFSRYFTGWWTTDARGGICDLDNDQLRDANPDTEFVAACKPCGAMVIARANSDDQSYLNAHREFHDRLGT